MKRNNPISSAAILLCMATGVLSPVASAASAAGTYPENPFASDHVLVEENEVGAAPGQVQAFILGALVSGGGHDDTYLGGKIGNDKILNEYAGVRFSVYQDVIESDGDSLDFAVTSFRMGPSFHFFPYRRIDMGVYGEGGLAVVDLVNGKTSTKAPEIVTGGFITYHVDSAFFIQAELERSWCNLDGDNSGEDAVPAKLHRSAALLGFGIAF